MTPAISTIDPLLDYGETIIIKEVQFKRLPFGFDVGKKQDYTLYAINITPDVIDAALNFNAQDENENQSTMDKSMETKKNLVDQAYNMFLDYWSTSTSVFEILDSKLFSMFLAVDYNHTAGILEVITVIQYLFSPPTGTFIPFIYVKESYRNNMIGSKMLEIFQNLMFSQTKTFRMMIWIGLDSWKKEPDAKKNDSLISFYRKYGFHPVPPMNFPLMYIFGHTFPEIASTDHDSMRKKNIHKSYILCVTHSISDFSENNSFERRKLLVSKTHKCEVCGIESFKDTDYKNFTVCAHQVQKSCYQMNIRNKIIPVCGLTLCLTCQNNFGHGSSERCPFHTETQDKAYDSPFPESIEGETNFVKRYLSSDKTREKYFASSIESLNGYQQEDDIKCMHCSVFYNTKDTKIQEPICLFSKYSNMKPSNLRFILKNSTDHKFFHQMNVIDNQQGMIKSPEASSYGKLENICKHPLFFDINCGKPSSSIQNKVFGLKNSLGYGDCGFLSILNAIYSTTAVLQEKIWKELHEYYTRATTKSFNFYQVKKSPGQPSRAKLERKIKAPSKIKENPVDPNAVKWSEWSKLKNEKPPDLKLLRDMFFLAKINPETYMDKNNSQKQDMFFTFPKKQKSTCKTIEKMVFFRKDNPEQKPIMKELQKLRTNYSQTSFKAGCAPIWLTNFDIVHFVSMTNNICGIILILDKNKAKEAIPNSCSISDAGYYQLTGKHLFRQCSHFMMLRHCADDHFDFYYDRISKRAIFPVDIIKDGKIEKQFDSKFLPFYTLLEKCNEELFYQLTGCTKTQECNNLEMNMFSNIVPEEALKTYKCLQMKEFSTEFNKYIRGLQYKDDIKLIENLDDSNNLTEIEKLKNPIYNVHRICPWIADTHKYNLSISDLEKKEDIEHFLTTEMANDSYVPFAFNCREMKTNIDPQYKFEDDEQLTLLDNQTFLMQVGYLHKQRLEGAIVIHICDINKTRFIDGVYTNQIMKMFTHPLKKIQEYSINDLVEKWYEDHWNLPNVEQFQKFLNNYLYSHYLHVFYKTGRLSNDLYQELGVYPWENHFINFDYLSECSRIMSQISVENEEKMNFFKLFCAFNQKDVSILRHIISFGYGGKTSMQQIYSIIEMKYSKVLSKSFLMNSCYDKVKELILFNFPIHLNDDVSDDELQSEITEFTKTSSICLKKNLIDHCGVFDDYKVDKFGRGQTQRESTDKNIDETLRDFTDKNIQQAITKITNAKKPRELFVTTSPRNISRLTPKTFHALKYFYILRKHDETEIFKKKKEKQDMELLKRWIIYVFHRKYFQNFLRSLKDEIQNDNSTINIEDNSLVYEVGKIEIALKQYLGYHHIEDTHFTTKFLFGSEELNNTTYLKIKYDLNRTINKGKPNLLEGKDTLNAIELLDEDEEDEDNLNNIVQKHAYIDIDKVDFEQPLTDENLMNAMELFDKKENEIIFDRDKTIKVYKKYFNSNFTKIQNKKKNKVKIESTYPRKDVEHKKEILLKKYEPSDFFDWRNGVNRGASCVEINKMAMSYYDMGYHLLQDKLRSVHMEMYIKILMTEKRFSKKTKNKVLAVTDGFQGMFSPNSWDRARFFLYELSGISMDAFMAGDNNILNTYDILLIPWNLKRKGHWILFAMHTKEQFITIYDSSSSEAMRASIFIEMVPTMMQIIYFVLLNGEWDECENSAKREDINYIQNNLEVSLNQYKIIETKGDIFPKQEDGVSCGVFVLATIYSIIETQDIKLFYTHECMSLFRRYIFHILSYYHGADNLSRKVEHDIEMIDNLPVDEPDNVNDIVYLKAATKRVAALKEKKKRSMEKADKNIDGKKKTKRKKRIEVEKIGEECKHTFWQNMGPEEMAIYKDENYQENAFMKEMKSRAGETIEDEQNIPLMEPDQVMVQEILEELQHKMQCPYISYVENEHNNDGKDKDIETNRVENYRYILSESDRAKIYGNDNMGVKKKIYHLNYGIVRTIRNQNNSFGKFFIDLEEQVLEMKSKWTKIPRSIRDRINELLCRQRYSVAYHYMDFHHIQYDDRRKKIFGMCYFKNQSILKLELRIEYFRDKDCPQRVEFQAALDAPNTLINCRIGKSRLLSRTKRSGRKMSSKETRQIKRIKVDECTKFKKGPQTVKFHEQKHYPGLKYYQGKKNLCFQYCFKSALFYHMQRKRKDNMCNDKETYLGIEKDI